MNKRIFSLWAVFDTVTLFAYLSQRLYYGNIPFYSDWQKFQVMAETFEMSFLYLIPISTVILYLSLPISIYGFSKQSNFVKWLTLGQLPFRFLSSTSTVPFVFGFIGLITPISLQVNFSYIYLAVIAILFFTIEIYKVFSIFKKQ